MKKLLLLVMSSLFTINLFAGEPNTSAYCAYTPIQGAAIYAQIVDGHIEITTDVIKDGHILVEYEYYAGPKQPKTATKIVEIKNGKGTLYAGVTITSIISISNPYCSSTK